MLVTISGPSGAGKSTLVSRLKQNDAKLLPSWTTRSPRVSTAPDTAYHYVSISDYLMLRERGELLLDENIALNNYGTKMDDVTFALEDAAIVWLADLSAKAVLNLLDKGCIPNLCIIIDVPKEVSEFRMEKRGDHPTDISNRIKRYDEELNNCNIIRSSHNNVILIDGLTNPDCIFKKVSKNLEALT